MKAAVIRRYGPPETVSIEEWPAPVPGKGEVPVRVTAAAVTAGDARLRSARAPAGMGPIIRLVFGLRGPRHPVGGMNFAGTLAGPAGALAEGSRVMGVTGLHGGAHAERLAVAAERLFPVPEGLTDAEAAGFFFGGLAAVSFLLDRAGLQPGERVLIHGATGEVGSAAVQIAAHAGGQVTAVARAENHDLARSLGAVACHDYRNGPPPGTYDAILDVAGHLPWPKARPLLAPGGRLVLVTATLAQMLAALVRPRRDGGRRVLPGVAGDTPAAMARLLEIHRAGGYRPYLGAVMPFAEIARAHALVDSGHKRGAVVVVMDQATETAIAAK